MQRKSLLGLLGLVGALILSGCVVRTYPLTRDRVDQNLNTGNRGYLQGQSSGAEVERKASRTTQIVEIELRSPLKFERGKGKTAAPVAVEETDLGEGNRGYISQSESPDMTEAAGMQQYTVSKNDTLQKISMKFYGTTKKWNKIYDANRSILKGPDKVYPGQVINIPTEGMKSQEAPANLK